MKIYSKIELEQVTDYKCDTCGKTTKKGNFIPIALDFSYGHDLDGNNYDFCSLKCLLEFVINEYLKENPRKNITFGGKK